MAKPPPYILNQAARWAARTREPTFDAWKRLLRWLEEDDTTNEAYELALDAHDASAILIVERTLLAPERQ